jgi:hypothetical protein
MRPPLSPERGPVGPLLDSNKKIPPGPQNFVARTFPQAQAVRLEPAAAFALGVSVP